MDSLSRRRDPTSGLVHVGKVLGDWERGREWVPRCCLWPRSNTTFWTCLTGDIPPTCLGCIAHPESAG